MQFAGAGAAWRSNQPRWVPFVVIGVAAIFLGLTTKQQGGYRYGKPVEPAGGAAR